MKKRACKRYIAEFHEKEFSIAKIFIIQFHENLMERDEAIKKIKEVILSTAKKHGIEVGKIILFGSRARGDYEKESDWDILIVTKEKINKEVFWKFLREIKIEISIKLKVPNDIIIVSEEHYKKSKSNVGDISYYATLEGEAL